MSMEPSPNDLQSQIEQRIRTLRFLWVALVLSIAGYYVLTRIAQPNAATPNDTLSLTMVVIGLVTIPVSVVIKKRFLNQAVELQQPQLVQQGYIIALAVNEVAALLGVFDFFITGNRYYFVMFMIAVCGQLLHFPKRQHVIDAYFRGPTL